MLDVHPPHIAPHTWRDFFVHIATIVIGLLIAIGLEQADEAFHQHREARETHEALQREYEENRQKVAQETIFWRRGIAALQNNLLVLRYLEQHPGTPQNKLPGTLYWSVSNMMFARAAWASAQQTGIVKFLPQQEVTKDSFLYAELQLVEDASNEAWLTINDAEEFTLTDPDPTHLAREQLATVISLTERALTKQLLCGEALLNLGSFQGFQTEITRSQLNALRGRNDPLPPSLGAAHALTLARINSATAEP